jgi:hypothetical protein
MILKPNKQTSGQGPTKKIAPMEQDHVSVTTAPGPGIQDKLATPISTPFEHVRKAMAEKLLVKTNQSAFGGKLQAPIRLVWNSRLSSTAGRAKLDSWDENSRNHIKDQSTIELSICILHNPERLRKTLVHELFHVAFWVID